MSELAAMIDGIGQRARVAARVLATLDRERKDAALLAMADELSVSAAAILAANSDDLAAGRDAGLTAAMLDRLALTPERLAAMVEGIRSVAALPDPVGTVLREWTPPSGLRLAQVRVPLGVIGFIYESRPNVTSDAAALCLKAGNAVVLRGGSEALRTNVAITAALRLGLVRAGLPEDAVQLVPTADRDAVPLLCAADQFLDLLIPRGGRGLVETVVSHARVPVIKHFDGLCSIYVDAAADLAMAVAIIVNAKCQRPGVCNAAETLLVHCAVAEPFLALAGPALLERKVELRVDERAFAALAVFGSSRVVQARREDYDTEFLELILAVRVVDNLDEAIAHIAEHGSHHSDTIVTSDAGAAERFLREVDSAAVYWNASTRFTDGAEFGFGAEIGISTDKIHARGPMGLEELTSYKYVGRGTGHVRA